MMLVRTFFMRPPGALVDGLKDVIALLPEQASVVEVGSWSGESALIFLTSGRVGSMILVDPYDPAFCGEILTHRSHIGSTVDGAYALLKQDVLDVYPNVRLIKMKSVEAAAQLVGQTFDMVYIDGHHGYQSVEADIRAWRPLVKPGGLLAGHDYNLKRVRHTQVRQVVTNLLGGPDQRFSDSSWVKRM